MAIGIISSINKFVKNKKLDKFDRFLLFNNISILYFILISAMWGNPKYFTPCMISLSFYFSIGFIEFKKKFFDKNK